MIQMFIYIDTDTIFVDNEWTFNILYFVFINK